MTVDGTRNTVEEVDVVAVEDDAANPYGNAFTTRTTVLEREGDAARLADAARSRTWRIVNRDRRNHVGQPVGYKLVPSSNPVLLARPGSSVAKRAVFATRHLWVTRYDPAERYAAGDYPNQHAGGAGLPAFQAADRDLVDEDVVVWHTFGSTHIPRPEDWPVMPVEHVGFSLQAGQLLRPQPGPRPPPVVPRRRVLRRDERVLSLTSIRRQRTRTGWRRWGTTTTPGPAGGGTRTGSLYELTSNVMP